MKSKSRIKGKIEKIYDHCNARFRKNHREFIKAVTFLTLVKPVNKTGLRKVRNFFREKILKSPLRFFFLGVYSYLSLVMTATTQTKL